MNTKRHLTRGFTIIELIVVIAIVGILATITLVVYGGVQNNARKASLMSDLDNAVSILELDLKQNGSYPATVGLANNGNGIPASPNTTYQYTVNNSAKPQTFCLTATNNGINYHITNNSTSTVGTCFIPSDIAGLNLWLDASKITGKSNGDSVGSWIDNSSAGNNAVQGTVSRQPVYKTTTINGKPVLHFSAGNSQTMTVSTNFPAPVTVIYVTHLTGATNSRMLSGLNNNWLLGYWNGGKRQVYFEGWVTPAGTPAADTNWYIYSAVITGTGINTKVYENGNLFAESQGGVTGPNGLSLSGYVAVSEFSDGEIAEIIIYNSALSDTDRAAVEAYLSSKYF